MLSQSIYLIFDVAPQVSSIYVMSGLTDWITTCHHISQICWRAISERLVHKEQYFVLNTSTYWQPMQTPHYFCHTSMIILVFLAHDSGSLSLESIKLSYYVLSCTTEESIAVVQSHHD